MSVHVGTAPDSWGVWFPEHPSQPPWQRFLDEVVEAGYDTIELGPFGYLPTTAERLEQELGSRGITLASGFLFRDFTTPDAFVEIRDELDRLVDLLAAAGAGYLVLINTTYTDLFTGAKLGPAELDPDTWRRMVATLHRTAEVAAAAGLRSVYHPHAETPVERPAQVERLLDDTEPDLIGLCLDTGHYAYRNGDVVDLIERRADRLGHLHLKNVDPAIRDRVETEGIPFAGAVGLGMFSDLKDGIIDFPAVQKALDAAGYAGWGIVEQDLFPTEPHKPLPIAKRNREYLRAIGMDTRTLTDTTP